MVASIGPAEPKRGAGSQSTVADRVFTLGLATSTDGIHFAKDDRAPVCRHGALARCSLTPTLSTDLSVNCYTTAGPGEGFPVSGLLSPEAAGSGVGG